MCRCYVSERERGTTIDREEFRARLSADFPDVVAQIRPDVAGLLQCEVSAFLRATEQAMDAGRFWAAEKHFRFVESILGQADAELRNALEISYLEELAWSEWTPQRLRAVKERMPKLLRILLTSKNPQWR